MRDVKDNIVVIGHLSIDHIKNRFFDCPDIAGGGVLYASASAGVLGNVIMLSTRCEDFPQSVIDEFSKHGIKNSVIDILGEQRRSFMEYSDKFDRTSYNHGRRIWYEKTIEQTPRHLPETDNGIILLQAMLPEVQKQYAIWGRKHGYTVAADTSEYFAEHETERLRDLLKYIDIFMPSEVETELMFKGAGNATRLSLIKECGVQILVEKRADKGCRIYDFHHEKILNIGIRKVEAKDATGAGDSFNGAFISALSKGMSLDESGRYAAVLASMCVEKLGWSNTICQTRESVFKYMSDVPINIGDMEETV